jgi:hypothetical protein
MPEPLRPMPVASVLSRLMFDNPRGAVPSTAPDALVRLGRKPQIR